MAQPIQTDLQAKRYALMGRDQDDLLSESKDLKEEILRLQSLITQWLRMENFVVLIGAGASVSRGGQVLARLENSILDLLEALYELEREPNLKIAITDRQANKNELGFEDWLSHLSNALHLMQTRGSPIEGFKWRFTPPLKDSDLSKLMEDLRSAIFTYCSLVLPELSELPTGHHAFIAKLIARDPGLGRPGIFTTNYDTLLEQALDDLAVQYQDGFVGKVNPRFDPSGYGLDIYYPGEVSEGRVRRYDKFLHLFKLHGSIHWSIQNEGREVRAIHRPLTPFAEWRETNTTPKKQAKTFRNLPQTDHPPIGILPTANKFVQTLDSPFSHLFRMFHQKLHQPQTFLLVVGYGFSDDHINRLIDDAMANPALVLLVVDPKPSSSTVERLSRYQKVGERVFLLRQSDTEEEIKFATFDDFSQNVMPSIRWLDDLSELRKLERLISQSD